ncbi:hypothetical protein KP509_13G016800 [Ceratopteris richardii]|uniref:Uncharacterized protein n=1 Tax=Ceratopteris richardii TaxID=49495 RepID=A0A8T2TJ62_CERRI|nr:hypothetical protein KP509_13G016800 [Ceratopteris richardii]KAH7420680.1 hypothetical protein KP509_13G016800 [Ceratopteris richardii]
MGCAGSKLESEVAVRRCKASKRRIKQAVICRHEFAAAHASYARSLKSTGAAIRQTVDAEISKDVPQGISEHHHVRRNVSNVRPPPHPQDPLVHRVILPRASSMPISIKNIVPPSSKGSLSTHNVVSEDEEEATYEHVEYASHRPTHSESSNGFFNGILEPAATAFENFGRQGSAIESRSELDDDDDDDDEDEDDDDDEEDDDDDDDDEYDVHGNDERSGEPRNPKQFNLKEPSLQSRTINQEEDLSKGGKKMRLPSTDQESRNSDKDFVTILRELDDLFLESHEAGRAVCQLLEARGDFYYTPFIEGESGMKEHYKIISSSLAWSKSEEVETAGKKGTDAKGELNLASTLDRLYAWEKKRCDEVKAVEITRLELDRKSAQLRYQKKRGASVSAMEKTKARVKSLHTRHLVEFEAVDVAVLAVKKLRDENLYEKLIELLKALKEMWFAMHNCHRKQVPLVEELEHVKVNRTTESIDICKKITGVLQNEVFSLRESLRKMLMSQNDCMSALLDWLQINTEQMESDAVDNIMPAQKEDIPLYDLCRGWADLLGRLSTVEVLDSLTRLISILRDMESKQADEINVREREQDLYREIEKKKKLLEAFEGKYKSNANAKEVTSVQDMSRNPVQEKRALIELLEKNALEEKERLAKLCEENSILIFQSLKDGLPDVIKSIANFSSTCAKAYGNLYDQILKRRPVKG